MSKLYYSLIGECRTLESWDKEAIRVYKEIGSKRPIDWWKRWIKLMEINTIPPDQRISKTYITNIGNNYRGRGLSQIVKDSKKRQRKSVTEIKGTAAHANSCAKGFVPDQRTWNQINAVMPLPKLIYQGEIVLKEPTEEAKIKKPRKKSSYKYPLGDEHHNSKLTQTDKQEIKKELLTGEYSHRQLAEKYNVSKWSITNINKQIKEGKL